MSSALPVELEIADTTAAPFQIGTSSLFFVLLSRRSTSLCETAICTVACAFSALWPCH